MANTLVRLPAIKYTDPIPPVPEVPGYWAKSSVPLVGLEEQGGTKKPCARFMGGGDPDWPICSRVPSSEYAPPPPRPLTGLGSKPPTPLVDTSGGSTPLFDPSRKPSPLAGGGGDGTPLWSAAKDPAPLWNSGGNPSPFVDPQEGGSLWG